MFIFVSRHARERLRERYGLTATPGLCWHIGKVLRASLPPTAGGRSNGAVRYRGRILRFVFDGRRREVVTFLPEEAATSAAV